jgi:hypothetical protein
MKRKTLMPPAAEAAIPTVTAFGKTIVQTGQAEEGPTHHLAADITVMMNDPAAKKEKQAAAGND